MMMGRNCNLELRLVTPSCDDHAVGKNACQRQPMIEEVPNRIPREKQQQQQEDTQKLTIFYKGTVSSCDVTESQARSIISVASQETVRDKDKEEMTPSCSEASSGSCPKPQVMMYKQDTGLSMKRSLQQFLQKRRTRIQATSPYCTP